jgi:hypothetical protein
MSLVPLNQLEMFKAKAEEVSAYKMQDANAKKKAVKER